MINRTYLMIATAMIAQSSVSQAGEAPATALRQADAGRLVSVGIGKEIAIQLPAFPGNSFAWRLRSHDGLQPLGPIEIVSDPLRNAGAPGDPQVAVIRLRATHAGRASAVIEESRVGGGFGSNYLRYRFDIR